MSLTTAITALDALRTDAQTHTPDLGLMLTQLLSELRMIDKMGLLSTTAQLNRDAENLADQLPALLRVRATGLKNEDTDAAERDISTLILDMRARATALIRETTGLIRVNAQVAASRADPDISAADITEGFRMMAAMPALRQDVEDAQSVAQVGLPTHGGVPGKITGAGLMMDVQPPRGGFFQESAPLGTFYLPAGRTVRLRSGDNVRVYHQGCGREGSIDLTHFKETLNAFDYETVGEDVVLHGPLTFGFVEQPTLSAAASATDDYLQAMGKTRIVGEMRSDEVDLVAMLTGCFGGITLTILMDAFILEHFGFWDFLGTLVAMGGIVVGTHVFLSRRLKKIYGRVASHTANAVNALTERTRAGQNVDFSSPAKAVESVQTLRSRIISVSALRVFASRKISIHESQGVRVVEPLKALPAPAPEADLGNVLRMKTPA